MLRLVLSGQFIASGELIDIEAETKADSSVDTAKALKALPDPHDAQIRDQPSHPPEAQMQAQADTDIAAKACAVSDLGLTPREKEVLAHVSQGGRNKTIAHQMSLSEHTVKLHLHNAITKIGARNRTEAATWYLSRQIGGGHEL
jgi:DNA-binding NarL/FixJ family response regulator